MGDCSYNSISQVCCQLCQFSCQDSLSVLARGPQLGLITLQLHTEHIQQAAGPPRPTSNTAKLRVTTINSNLGAGLLSAKVMDFSSYYQRAELDGIRSPQQCSV